MHLPHLKIRSDAIDRGSVATEGGRITLSGEDFGAGFGGTGSAR